MALRPDCGGIMCAITRHATSFFTTADGVFRVVRPIVQDTKAAQLLAIHNEGCTLVPPGCGS